MGIKWNIRWQQKEGNTMKLKKEDIETLRELDRRRLLKLGSAGAFVTFAGASLLTTTTSAEAKDGDPGDPYDNDPYDDTDIRDGRTGNRRRRRRRQRVSDPADSDPYNGADSD